MESGTRNPPGISLLTLVLARINFKRCSAAGLAIIILGAITTVQVPYGFFINWFGQQ
jgi:hypothetical protein